MNDFQSRLLLAIHGIAEEDLRRPEAEGKWSIADVIAHLGDLELVYAVRMRTALALDAEPDVPALKQNEWVANVHGREPVAELLEQFWFHRRMNLSWKARLTETELARKGRHPEYGPITIAQMFERIANHDEKHLRQIERIKTTLGLAAATTPDVSGVVAGSLIEERSPGPGVRVREIWRDGVRKALEVDFDPGAQWPGIDYHVPGPEEVYVLGGDLDDGANVYRAGTFVHHPAGSSHSPRSSEGCRLFVFYPEG
ncbi:MAG TPA: DinB family protein [Thermoanaerobaculia bacterium]|nr:DinB family protein [Thermoanaerobaculia bacterium]